jgi:hypothetical protein
MNELATLLTRVRAAANDTLPDGAAYCSEPRVYPPGHPAAAMVKRARARARVHQEAA